jgi:hypothetical protein
MKLRIKGNSLRLRVTRSELDRLIRTGRIEETTWFGLSAGCRLTYALEVDKKIEGVTLRCATPEIAVLIPCGEAAAWKNSDQVGIYATADLGLRGFLELVVEKDFACLDRSDEENLDTFPNPLAGAVC